jgi:hypothetical protein
MPQVMGGHMNNSTYYLTYLTLRLVCRLHALLRQPTLFSIQSLSVLIHDIPPDHKEDIKSVEIRDSI